MYRPGNQMLRVLHKPRLPMRPRPAGSRALFGRRRASAARAGYAVLAGLWSQLAAVVQAIPWCVLLSSGGWLAVCRERAPRSVYIPSGRYANSSAACCGCQERGLAPVGSEGTVLGAGRAAPRTMSFYRTVRPVCYAENCQGKRNAGRPCGYHPSDTPHGLQPDVFSVHRPSHRRDSPKALPAP